MKKIALLMLMQFSLFAGEYDKVQITPKMSYMYVYHKGKAVKVHRIQDTNHKLTGEYTKLYRSGKELQPIKMQQGIATIGEVEVLSFMKSFVNTQKGIVIDVRDKESYQKESIPSAINIPFSTKDNTVKMHKILNILGLNEHKNMKNIVIYAHGAWDNEASQMIKTMVDLGYPADKILYYRGGFQMWKILGFTTVINQLKKGI